jgi:hypothetical protein
MQYDTVIFWLVAWNIFIFPYIGNNSPNWLIFFQRGWNHQPVLFLTMNNVTKNYKPQVCGLTPLRIPTLTSQYTYTIRCDMYIYYIIYICRSCVFFHMLPQKRKRYTIMVYYHDDTCCFSCTMRFSLNVIHFCSHHLKWRDVRNTWWRSWLTEHVCTKMICAHRAQTNVVLQHTATLSNITQATLVKDIPYMVAA